MRFRYNPLALALLAGGLAAGCLADAERSNPLDPLADNFRDEGVVAGEVVRASRPSEGVPEARVRLLPVGGGVEHVADASDNGAFSLREVPSGTYTLTAEAPGYTPADTTLTVDALEPLPSVVLPLNALPHVTAQDVHTERINRFFPPPLTFSRLVVEATVADPDGLGDVAAVELVIPDFNGFRAPLLAVTGTEGGFAQTFEEDELPVGLQDFLGHNLYIEVTDQEGATARGEDAHVTRIVESIPLATAPEFDPLNPIRPPFEMTWEPLSLPYAFTWRIEIFFVAASGQSAPFLEIDGLPRTQTQMTITDDLVQGGFVAGDYQWFVSAVDAFGNLARSQEKGFRIASN
jgi:hypothetical protein